ncbi:class I SAM-dependent rRNA methyltransferase [Ahniella affigens]|uniref:class I SAM-dependent rRNA methyltransferase n=1 Tax=Ahniella affigens TaxID=2021234 RepID=UPI00197E3DBC|nr:class I SAM-dependent rRNA methyltransferase [Ahniella affigens]
MTTEIEYPALFLKRGEDARLKQGHVWVFSNEVDTARSPLNEFEPGERVAIVDASGRLIGLGYINPHALICARLLVRGAEHGIDRSLISHRLNVAASLRAMQYDEPYHRLVFGESDGLPGLVIDRFGPVLVGQIGTLGMEQLKPEIEAAIQKTLKPEVLVWKNQGSVRQLENLPEYVEVAIGSLPTTVIAREHGVDYAIDVEHGQKTGFFYDQRDNRGSLARLVDGKRVLDLFSYVGAWGLAAARFGASEVLAVDVSDAAVERVRANADRNGFADRVRAESADAFEFLKHLRQQRERFDVVIVDPPAFSKRKKDFAEARLAYRRINEMAMQVLARDGLLVSCSCSYHMPYSELISQINQGARHLDRQALVLKRLQQSADHPVVPAIPETEYLKGALLRVLPS